jgi:ATP phosphoribosyltransferase
VRSQPINTQTDLINSEVLELVGNKTLVLPKNSGLSEYYKLLEDLPSPKLVVRGEDVPFFIDKLSSKGVRCVGLTGQDLLKEYKLKNPFASIKEIKNLGWSDTSAIFGKPTLCLLGPVGKELKNLDMFGAKPKIVINSKYKSIAENYLGKLIQKGYSFEKIYLSGATETAFELGVTDLVIDIVVSGSSARKVGLRVYDRIFESEAILVGGVNE